MVLGDLGSRISGALHRMAKSTVIDDTVVDEMLKVRTARVARGSWLANNIVAISVVSLRWRVWSDSHH